MTEIRDSDEIPVPIEYAQPDGSLKPIYLFADSQPLFWKEEDGRPFLRSLREQISERDALAVYIGASNGDELAYYSIFEAAMGEAGFTERRMILSSPGADELADLDRADLILLAGGDVERGWRVFEQNGLKQILVRRYYEGALMVGISAGAVQLGLAGWASEGDALIDTLRIVPYAIGAHEEADDWQRLKAAVERLGPHVRGYGVPFGGGLVCHVDRTIEPLRRPIHELEMRGERVASSVLMPGEGPADAQPVEDAGGDAKEPSPSSGASPSPGTGGALPS